MAYLSKKDTEKVIKKLSNSKSKEISKIINKLKSEKRIEYARTQPEIERLIKKAFQEKKQLKIRYYSLSSDEVTSRIIDIYQIHKNCIVAFCHLRDEERTFVTSRIQSAAILDGAYSIPKGWSPESIILNK
jgi:predicted DNA-binding transcriptional regulator YafY